MNLMGLSDTSRDMWMGIVVKRGKNRRSPFRPQTAEALNCVD